MYKFVVRKLRALAISYALRMSAFFVKLGVRPIIFLDSDICELEWLDIAMEELSFQGLKKLTPVILYRIKLELNDVDDFGEKIIDNKCLYRGVDLFLAIEYSLYAELEIQRGEFDINNKIHFFEAMKWLNCAKIIADELYDLFSKVKPVSVVSLQGYFVECAIARQLAEVFRYQFYALENTFFYKKIICEPITGVAVNKTSIMSFFYRFQHLIIPKKCHSSESWIQANIKHQDHSSPLEVYRWPRDKKRILFLGQCLTDSSLLFCEPNYSIVEVLKELQIYSAENNAHLFIKLHPKENNGKTPLHKPYAKLTFRKLTESAYFIVDEDNYYIDFENKYSTQELIYASDVVITINSQAGLESLALGKEVVLLGKAFYDQLGCTWNVPHLSVLGSCLDAILFGNQSLHKKNQIDMFMEVYFNYFCVDRRAKELIAKIISRRISYSYFE